MKNKKAMLALLLCCTLLLTTVLILCCSGKDQAFTGKTAEYCDALMAAGFPEDYAVALTKLHLVHPTWSFQPLQILQHNANYTWDYVIDKETENPKTNLIFPEDTYAAYHHPTNREPYDSGLYQPSTAAVEYFMDPRNFLNEADIFQFYDLSNPRGCTEETLRAVLSGSFMESARLENGMTYSAYLMEIGKEIGIDPVFLASKLRQEQGSAGTSPVISGSCGDLLWSYYQNQTQTTDGGKQILPPASGESEAALLALNGLYNPFNIGASGTGVFAIYKGAMQRAASGTDTKAADWGGSPAWDTVWKGIYGGALFIKQAYIEQYQSTVYLQKFNVDGRAGAENFSGQYMQNLAGAMTEGRSLFGYFAANNSLDDPCSFLIPVYTDMPKSCPDPANGSCRLLAQATNRYQTHAALTSPLSFSAENDGIFGEVELTKADTLTVKGSFTHSYGVRRLQYSWDGEHWQDCAQNGELELTFFGNLPSYGAHILMIRGEAAYDASVGNQKQNRYFLCAALNVTVIPPPSVELTLRSGNAESKKLYYEGDEVLLPSCEDPTFAGWVGSDGTLLPSCGKLTLKAHITYTALFLDLRLLPGAAISLETQRPQLRFYAVLPQQQLQALQALTNAQATLAAHISCNGSTAAAQPATALGTLTSASGTPYQQFAVQTEVLIPAALNDAYSAEFHMTLRYTGGGEKQIKASGEPTVRTAAEVIASVLADPTPYSASARHTLEQLLSYTN